jgi:hypothetical protein
MQEYDSDFTDLHEDVPACATASWQAQPPKRMKLLDRVEAEVEEAVPVPEPMLPSSSSSSSSSSSMSSSQVSFELHTRMWHTERAH